MGILDKLFGKKKTVTSLDIESKEQMTEVKGYPGTHGVEKLMARETPHQILSEDFPKHNWPISGGWGYTQEDAVVIEVDNSWDGVNLEYKYLEYRSYEEAIIFRPKGSQLAGFRFERGNQALIHGNDGKSYDMVTMTVLAFTEGDFNLLKNDFETHHGYQDDAEGLKRHMELAESKRIRYEVVGWFDITRFFGK